MLTARASKHAVLVRHAKKSKLDWSPCNLITSLKARSRHHQDKYIWRVCTIPQNLSWQEGQLSNILQGIRFQYFTDWVWGPAPASGQASAILRAIKVCLLILKATLHARNSCRLYINSFETAGFCGLSPVCALYPFLY